MSALLGLLNKMSKPYLFFLRLLSWHKHLLSTRVRSHEPWRIRLQLLLASIAFLQALRTVGLGQRRARRLCPCTFFFSFILLSTFPQNSLRLERLSQQPSVSTSSTLSLSNPSEEGASFRGRGSFSRGGRSRGSSFGGMPRGGSSRGGFGFGQGTFRGGRGGFGSVGSFRGRGGSMGFGYGSEGNAETAFAFPSPPYRPSPLESQPHFPGITPSEIRFGDGGSNFSFAPANQGLPFNTQTFPTTSTWTPMSSQTPTLPRFGSDPTASTSSPSERDFEDEEYAAMMAMLDLKNKRS